VALVTAQRHPYRPRPDTDVTHLHGRSSAPASRESVACRRSGVKRAPHDDEQKPIRRLLLVHETGTLGCRTHLSLLGRTNTSSGGNASVERSTAAPLMWRAIRGGGLRRVARAGVGPEPRRGCPAP
jgi:hypothetical protein